MHWLGRSSDRGAAGLPDLTWNVQSNGTSIAHLLGASESNSEIQEGLAGEGLDYSAAVKQTQLLEIGSGRRAMIDSAGDEFVS